MLIITALINCEGLTSAQSSEFIHELYNGIKYEFDNKCKLIVLPVIHQPSEIKIHDTNNYYSLEKLEKELLKLCNTQNKYIRNSLKTVLRYIKIKKINN